MTDTEATHTFTPAMTKTQKQLYNFTLSPHESKEEDKNIKDKNIKNFQAKHTDTPNPIQTPVPTHTAPIPSPTFTAEEIKIRSQAVLKQRKAQLEQIKLVNANEEQAKEQRRQERKQNQIVQITNLYPGIQQKSIDATINTAMNPPEQPDGEALSDLARTIELSKMAKVQLGTTADSEAPYFRCCQTMATKNATNHRTFHCIARKNAPRRAWYGLHRPRPQLQPTNPISTPPPFKHEPKRNRTGTRSWGLCYAPLQGPPLHTSMYLPC